jgi:hypothetical protein
MTSRPDESPSDTTGKPEFVDILTEELGERMATKIYQEYAERSDTEGVNTIDASPERRAERAKAFIPDLDFVQTSPEYSNDLISYISSLTDVHDLPEPKIPLYTDADVLDESEDEINYFDTYILDYGLIDSIMTGSDIDNSEDVSTQPDDILEFANRILESQDDTLLTPRHINFYIRKEYGREFRSLGDSLDKTDDTPEEMETDGVRSPLQTEIAAHANQIDAVVVTTNGVTAENAENIASPSSIKNFEL